MRQPFGGAILVSGSLDTHIKIWDLRMKACVNTFKSHNDAITTIDISPDSKMIISGSEDGTIKFWDISSNKLVKSLQVSS